MKIELEETDWSNKIQRMNKAEQAVKDIETIIEEYDVMDTTKLKLITTIISIYNKNGVEE